MNFVRVVRKSSAERLEREVNEILSENIKNNLVEIKYSSSPKENTIIYSALIIFERPN